MIDWSKRDIEFVGGDIGGEQESIVDLLLYEITCGAGTFSNLPELGLSLGDVFKLLTTDLDELKNMIYMKLLAGGIEIPLDNISVSPSLINVQLSDFITVTLSKEGVRARKLDPAANQDRSQTYDAGNYTDNPVLDRRNL